MLELCDSQTVRKHANMLYVGAKGLYCELDDTVGERWRLV